MIILTGNGRVARAVELGTTHSGKTVATIAVATNRRDRTTAAVYVDLVVWEGQATAAAEHLVKGQAVSFSGRLEPRQYVTSAGEPRVALELHGVDLEFGAKPRCSGGDGDHAPEPETEPGTRELEDIPF